MNIESAIGLKTHTHMHTEKKILREKQQENYLLIK